MKFGSGTVIFVMMLAVGAWPTSAQNSITGDFFLRIPNTSRRAEISFSLHILHVDIEIFC